MKIKNILCAALIGVCTILNPLSVSAAAGDWPAAPDVVSENAILMDADTGEILYEKNAYEKGFPASVTKIMTGLLTIENCNMSDTVTFSYEAAHSYALGDSNIGIWANENLTVEQTLRAILMASANEACYGIGEYISGSEAAFVELMNTRAAELGALDTHFANTNGLHDNNHYTTCYDLAMIGRACFDNSLFLTICSDTTTYVIPPTNKYKDNRYLRNKHGLLKARDYYYEYALGGKTGYTEEAGSTLISFAEKNGTKLICVIMRSTDDQRYTDTINLFEYGFNNFEKTALTNDTLAGFLSDSDNTFEPENFFNTSDYRLALSENLYALLPIGADTEDITAKCDLTGDKFARITFMYGDHALGSTDIIATKDAVTISNLPVLIPVDDVTTTQQSKEYKIIDLRICIIAFAVVFIITVAVSYYLIMNKTDYGIKKKRDRMRRRRRR